MIDPWYKNLYSRQILLILHKNFIFIEKYVEVKSYKCRTCRAREKKKMVGRATWQVSQHSQ